MNTFKLTKSILKKIVPYQVGVKLRGGWQKIMGFYFKGSNYYCPYCKQSFRKFLPGGQHHAVIVQYQIIGSGYRENTVCPRCYSTDRDRLIYAYLNEKGFFESKLKLLHIAPEGSLRAYIQQKTQIEYITGDKQTDGYTDYYYQRGITNLDLVQLPFKDETFDAIICNHVLEHILDDNQAMRELFRVLKKNAWAILQVPFSPYLSETYENQNIILPKDREQHFGQFDHVRIYGLDYTERLKAAGFRVSINHLSVEKYPEISTFAVNPQEPIFVAEKIS
jgi:SAM-dependent methyltransferase